jgi:MFS family permease
MNQAMAEVILSINRSRRTYRIAVGTLFFMQGLCFATWASRIPSIQQQLKISDTMLGLILFAIPLGSVLSLVFSGALVAKFGSKKVAANALLLYSLFLPIIGFSNNPVLLCASLVGFGMAGNFSNIAINTQAVYAEAKYGKNIMASFHGLWSLAGFIGAGVGSYMIGNGIVPLTHFVLISTVIVAGVAIIFQNLLPDQEQAGNASKFFIKPDKTLLKLGVLAFCCMICEGAMFDWSGIYFQKVVKADKSWAGAGFTAFMCAMATGRFVADWVANQLKFRQTIFLSGLLIVCGLCVAIGFPFVGTAILGFMLVGFGVSSVIPLVYSEAGKSKTVSPGMALTAVSSIGFLGFLIGPPVIGVLAGAVSLRLSFTLVALMGLLIMILMRKNNNGS